MIFSALLISTALISCNKHTAAVNNTPPKAAPVAKKPETPPQVITRQPDHAPEGWTLTFKAKCEETVEAKDCLGSQGFTLYTDGHYQIGPAPDEVAREGKLSPEELTELKALLAPTLALSTLGAENHETLSTPAPGTGATPSNLDGDKKSDDMITLTRGAGTPEVLVRTVGPELYFQVPTSEEAKSILSKIRGFAGKYYVTPYPDACKDGAVKLQKLFVSVQTCNADTDCTFIDSESFEGISPSGPGILQPDNCSIVSPLVVGNTQLLTANQSKLAELQDKVRTACGNDMIRPDCTQPSEFVLNGKSPTCQQGVCKLPAATQ